MKNRFRSAALSFAVMALAFSSCNKLEHLLPHHHTESWQTTTADSVIAANHTMVMILPANMSGETPIISTNAKNASVSTLAKDSATGNWVYTYTPITDFTGTDQVIFDSEDEAAEHHDGSGHHEGHHGGGMCGNSDGDKDDHNRLVLNITINPAKKDR
jgi:hypothetical protein